MILEQLYRLDLRIAELADVIVEETMERFAMRKAGELADGERGRLTLTHHGLSSAFGAIHRYTPELDMKGSKRIFYARSVKLGEDNHKRAKTADESKKPALLVDTLPLMAALFAIQAKPQRIADEDAALIICCAAPRGAEFVSDWLELLEGQLYVKLATQRRCQQQATEDSDCESDCDDEDDSNCNSNESVLRRVPMRIGPQAVYEA